MAARAYWQGQIKLALVSIPVEIYPATRSGATLSFHQIHQPSGKRIRYEKVVDGIGAVDHDDIVRGYEVAKGDYILLDDEEIEAAEIESRRTLDLVQFVAADEVGVLYAEKPYYVLPADDLAQEAYGVLRDALAAAGKVGIGQLAVRGREQLVSLAPCGKGLVLDVLRYADEVHPAAGFFDDLPHAEANADLIELATALIDKRSKPFKPDAFRDRYVDALKRVIDKKRKAGGHKRILEDAGGPDKPKGGNVIDLMAALRKSVSGGEKDAAAPKQKARPATKAKAPTKPRRRKA